MIRITLALSAAVVAIGLAACAPATTTGTPPISTSAAVANSVVAAQIALTNAERLALRYTSLPRCGLPASPPLCSDPATVERIKAADNVAYDAVMRARRNEATVDAALAAIGALGATIPR